jgi:hypothetical protein
MNTNDSESESEKLAQELEQLGQHTEQQVGGEQVDFDLDPEGLGDFTTRDLGILIGILATITVGVLWMTQPLQPAPKVDSQLGVTTIASTPSIFTAALPKAPYVDNPVIQVNSHGEVECKVDFKAWKLICPEAAVPPPVPPLTPSQTLRHEEVKRLTAMVTFQTVQAVDVTDQAVDEPPAMVLNDDGSMSMQAAFLPVKSDFIDEKADWQEAHQRKKKKRSKS